MSRSASCRGPSRRRRSHPRTPDAAGRTPGRTAAGGGPGRSTASRRRTRAPAPRARTRRRRARPAAPCRRRGGGRLVHRVVHGAAEVPDGDDGAPLLGRQDEKRIVEAGLARHQTRTAECAVQIARRATEQRLGGDVTRRRRGVRARRVEQMRAPSVRRSTRVRAMRSGAAEPGEAQLVAEPAADAVADLAAGVELALRVSATQPLERRHPRRASATGRSARLRARRTPPATSRGTYKPAGAPVAAEVLPEVRQLQRRAQRIRRPVERRRRDSRRCAARAGRSGWPIGGSSRARRPTKRIGSSWYPARTRSADRRTARSADRAIESSERARRRSNPRARCGAVGRPLDGDGRVQPPLPRVELRLPSAGGAAPSSAISSATRANA